MTLADHRAMMEGMNGVERVEYLVKKGLIDASLLADLAYLQGVETSVVKDSFRVYRLCTYVVELWEKSQ